MYKNSWGEFPEITIVKGAAMPMYIAAKAIAVARGINEVTTDGNKATIHLKNGEKVVLTIGRTVYADLITVYGSVVEQSDAKPFIAALKIHRGDVLEVCEFMDYAFLAEYHQKAKAYASPADVPPAHYLEAVL